MHPVSPARPGPTPPVRFRRTSFDTLRTAKAQLSTQAVALVIEMQTHSSVLLARLTHVLQTPFALH